MDDLLLREGVDVPSGDDKSVDLRREMNALIGRGREVLLTGPSCVVSSFVSLPPDWGVLVAVKLDRRGDDSRERENLLFDSCLFLEEDLLLESVGAGDGERDDAVDGPIHDRRARVAILPETERAFDGRCVGASAAVDEEDCNSSP